MNKILLDGDEYKVPKKGRFEIVHPNGSVNRFFNGKLHHETLPALDYYDGTKEWYYHGKKHRVDGPAHITSEGDKLWWRQDKLHRIDGPAITYDDGSQYWYLYGYQVLDPNEFRKILGLNKEQLLFLKLKWAWFREV